jgi:hypothetical protein
MQSRRLRLSATALVVAGCVGLAGASAFAQPMQLPGAAPATPQGAPQAPATSPRPAGPSGPPRTAAPVRQVAEDAIVGQAMLHQGRNGRLVMERIRGGYGMRVQMEGFQTTNLLEPCGISLGDQPVPLENLGRPAGLPRFRLTASVCPIVFEVLNNAMLVIEPQQPCIVEAAQCRIIPRGLWAPDGRGLVALAGEITSQRTTAEAQVREGFRTLGDRSGPDDKRLVAREQAGFSSEREQICREFNRELNHGFCAVKITEARAASLQQRITDLARTPRRQ